MTATVEARTPRSLREYMDAVQFAVMADQHKRLLEKYALGARSVHEASINSETLAALFRDTAEVQDESIKRKIRRWRRHLCAHGWLRVVAEGNNRNNVAAPPVFALTIPTRQGVTPGPAQRPQEGIA